MKVFNDEMPKVPASAFQYLGAEGNKFRSDDLLLESPMVENMLNFVRGEIGALQTEQNQYFSETQQTFSLVPLFEQPGTSPNFEEIVKSQNICLERVDTDLNACISGLVRVVNLAYHKLVTVVWSKDAWKTVNEQSASYVADSSEGGTDQFSFLLELSCEDTEVEICLRFSCQGNVHWDNNMGRNYKFQAMQCQPT